MSRLTKLRYEALPRSIFTLKKDNGRGRRCVDRSVHEHPNFVFLACDLGILRCDQLDSLALSSGLAVVLQDFPEMSCHHHHWRRIALCFCFSVTSQFVL